MQNLSTERLKFRLWEDADFELLHEFFSNEEQSRFVGGVQDEEPAWRLMATYLGHYQLRGYSYLAIETKEDRLLIGTVGLWNSVPWPEPEMGYWLLPRAQGKGYGLEAGEAVKQFAKDRGLPSLVSYIDERNEPSKRLALKLGAFLDGETELLNFGRHRVYRYW